MIGSSIIEIPNKGMVDSNRDKNNDIYWPMIWKELIVDIQKRLLLYKFK